MSTKPWKKNLYENREYPDNYTDSTFLEELRKNIYIKNITLLEAIIHASHLTQEICVIVLFTLTYIYMYNEWIDPKAVLMYSSLFTLIGFITYRKINIEYAKTPFTDDISTVLIFVVFGYISSPVLHTLTDTVSTDTIHAMTCFMLIVHLIFFDYGLSAAILPSSLSLNAAIFGSICLASRLSSPLYAFAFMTVSVECFALFPILRKIIPHSLFIITVMILLSIYFLYLLSTTLMFFFLLIIFLINILCPIWFLRWYRYKENIYGPWDEAVVHDTENIDDIIKKNS